MFSSVSSTIICEQCSPACMNYFIQLCLVYRVIMSAYLNLHSDNHLCSTFKTFIKGAVLSALIHTCRHAFMYMHIHTYILIHAYIYAYVHTCIHTVKYLCFDSRTNSSVPLVTIDIADVILSVFVVQGSDCLQEVLELMKVNSTIKDLSLNTTGIKQSVAVSQSVSHLTSWPVY